MRLISANAAIQRHSTSKEGAEGGELSKGDAADGGWREGVVAKSRRGGGGRAERGNSGTLDVADWREVHPGWRCRKRRCKTGDSSWGGMRRRGPGAHVSLTAGRAPPVHAGVRWDGPPCNRTPVNVDSSACPLFHLPRCACFVHKTPRMPATPVNPPATPAHPHRSLDTTTIVAADSGYSSPRTPRPPPRLARTKRSAAQRNASTPAH